MEGASLFSLPEGMQVSQIQITDNGIVVEVIATVPTSCCPLCSEPSSSIHCHYRRDLRDVPCAGRRVQLFLTVRKFSCRNPLCQQKVFAERIPTFVEPWARMTIRYGQQITSIGLATCGKGGARLAACLGIQTTRQTILRRIMDLPENLSGSILFLGIDDFSFLRGYRFGTILVNLESHRVVDLLPDRKANTSAAWMRQHPDLMAISRDCGGEYASAAREGAPQAIQCADRFHLLKNLGEALEGLLARHLAIKRKKQTQETLDEHIPIWHATRSVRRSPKMERLQQAYREERLACYEQVVALRKLGMSQDAIAERVGMSQSTVSNWLLAGTYPETTRGPYISRLDPYLPYLFQRWESGCHNMACLFRELVDLGYKGSYASVRDHILRLLPGGKKNAARGEMLASAPLSSRQAAFLFLRRPEKLSVEEQETMLMLRQFHPEVDLAYELVQQFAQMLRERAAERLDAWLAQVLSSGLPELQSFAAGVEKDKDAVRAGLTWWINNGMVEGHVTKLKLMKRQGYGRAGFPLLRKRVLHAI
ncbi:ISL3 family transposase [Ktedonobacter racemifer]|uniref:Transcriptional regulator, XRE family n=1 Tax=Ktedonobacter racemifer DSM 44963 TaxID=485913 RepID=D6TUC1_KTERA|nr:transcriptional regulator, XRE family [Ktedonobacter racemifer DSM 44963]